VAQPPAGTEERLRAVLTSLPVLLIAWDRAKVCTIAEGRGLEALGVRVEDIVGCSVDELSAGMPEMLESAEQTLRGESSRRSLDAGESVLDTYFSPLHDDGGAIIGGLVVAVDVTERRRIESALRDSLDRLRQSDAERQRLIGYLVTAQEEERARIAADVHDDTLQALAAVKMRLELLTDVLGEEQRHRLARVEADLEAASQRLRRLIFSLRPSALDNDTLGHALEQLMAHACEGRVAATVVDNLQAAPGPGTRAVVYRIAQEAVSNALQHAGARSLRMELDDRDAGVLVGVRDDGCGFDYQHASRAQLPGHLGLSTMRERAEVAGGWLRVESAPGEGTLVAFWIPRG
jgi:signal transduction histidine kinase